MIGDDPDKPLPLHEYLSRVEDQISIGSLWGDGYIRRLIEIVRAQQKSADDKIAIARRAIHSAITQRACDLESLMHYRKQGDFTREIAEGDSFIRLMTEALEKLES